MKYDFQPRLCHMLLIVLLIVLPVSVLARPSTSMPESELVSKALGEPFLGTVGKGTGNRHRLTVHLTGPTGSASLDKETGILIAFTRNMEGHDESGDITLTADEAHTKASTFLANVGVQPEASWVLTKNRFLSHGAGDREYTLEWRRFFHGVELPSLIHVSVNADTGEVEDYFLFDDPVTIPLDARLSAQDAVQVIAKKAGWAHPAIDEVWPAVWYQPYYPGPQVLLWRIHLTNSDVPLDQNRSVQATVNAMTGVIVSYLLPLSKARVGIGTKIVVPSGSFAKLPSLPKLNLIAARTGSVPATVFQLAKRNH